MVDEDSVLATKEAVCDVDVSRDFDIFSGAISMPTYGYTHEIINLMRKMKSRGVSRLVKVTKGKQSPIATKFDKELWHLEC